MIVRFDRRRMNRLLRDWWPTSTANSKPPMKLGDKMQVLAGISPWHLGVVEKLVDQMLSHLDRRTHFVILSLSLEHAVSEWLTLI
jgi:hypothetical protein